MTWHWIDKRALSLLHEESLAEHGGVPGIRDEGLLGSALARPLNLAANETPDFAELAASYTISFSKNHVYMDGNNRAALLVTGLFLYLN